MAMPKTQANTFVSVSTPLGSDVLLLETLSGVESISRPFHFELGLLSEDPEIDFTKIVGQPITITLDLHGANEPRYLHGHIRSFTQLRNRDGFAHYRAELVPWLWFLTQTTDCRIFQNKSVDEIIEQVCQDLGHRDLRSDLSGSYAKLEYCVQYRETDFAFVSRLMEHFGISYFFEHKKDKHVLVLVDSPAKFPECPGQKKARYKEDDRVTDLLADPGIITDLQLRQEVHSGKISYRDHNFERPPQTLEVAAKGTIKVDYASYEQYDYPGKYLVRDQGESLAKLRMQSLEARHLMISGSSTCRPFLPGYTFELTEHPRPDANTKYLLLSVRHDLCAGGYTKDVATYTNCFVCIPAKAQLRPERLTPKPRVEGPQTAVVVGESGEEIYTDKHGRIKVQFFWDRQGKQDQESSCWVRVSQGWSGKGWGAMFIPRIGMEVIVDFLEGDPDQPLVTGAVYNAQQTPPYPLPAERSKSTIKTNSYKGDGFNELRFEDKSGSEEIFVHAQKDQNEVILHDHTTDVGNDQTLKVGHDQSETVGNNQTVGVGNDQSITVGHDQTVQIDNDQNTSVSGHMMVTISKTLTETVGINYAETVGMAMELTVGASFAETVGISKNVNIGKSLSESIGASHSESINDNLTVEAGKNIQLTAGKQITEKSGKELTLDAGTKVVIVAADEISLKTGSASIVLKKSGDISISGAKITVKASGDLVLKGSKIAQN
jgi:type VI secretion system secreted protein VgrG